MIIKRSNIFSFILTLITLVLLLIVTNNLSTVTFSLFLIIILLLIVKEDKAIVLNSFFIGIFSCVLVYKYWLSFYGNEYYLGLQSDDYNYDITWTSGFLERYGLRLYMIDDFLDSIQNGLGVLHNSKGYVILIILVKWISSLVDVYHTLNARILNVFFLALTAHYSSLITYHYTSSKKMRKLTFFFVFFYPVMLYNSVHVFRDTLISLLIIMIYYFPLKSRYSIKTLLMIMISMLVMYYLRFSTFFLSILMLTILYLNPNKLNIKLLISLMIFFGIVFYYFSETFQILIEKTTKYGDINIKRSGSIGSKIFALPIYIGAIPRFIYLIFTPVISLSNFHQFFVSISAILQVFYFPFFYWSFKNKSIDLKIKIVFLMFFMGVALSTVTFRHVMMYLPFGIIISIISYHHKKIEIVNLTDYLKPILLLIALFFISLSLAYFF